MTAFRLFRRRLNWGYFGLAAMIGAACLIGCGSNPPNAPTDVRINTEFKVDPLVENGWAYDKATLELGKDTTLVLPEDAEIQRSGADDIVTVYMEKELSYGGHPGPGHPISIRNVRTKMGCASRAENNKLVIATYGAWDSEIEGGCFMKVRFVVSKSVTVDKRPGLSGPVRGRRWKDGPLSREQIKPGVDGWTEIPCVPDPR